MYYLSKINNKCWLSFKSQVRKHNFSPMQLTDKNLHPDCFCAQYKSDCPWLSTGMIWDEIPTLQHNTQPTAVQLQGQSLVIIEHMSGIRHIP